MIGRYINKLIGQRNFKREITFLLENFQKTDYFGHLLMVSPRGCGKSFAAKAIGAELSKITEEKYGTKKGFININCAEIKSCDVFFTQLFPLITQHERVTIFFDEFHLCGDSFVCALLSILNPSASRTSEYFLADGTKFTFDFSRLTILAATTAPEKCHPDCLDRMRRVELDEYETNELAEIIRSQCKGIKIDEDVLQEAAKTVKCNARRAIMRGEDIKSCGVNIFGQKEWGRLKYNLSIYPMGLSKIEIAYLKLLQKMGSATLTECSSRLSLTNSAVQQDIEVNLRRCGFFRTNGPKGRTLTNEGRAVLHQIETEYA